MTSPADLSHAVLVRVAEFLRTLPADQLAALTDGSARLQLAATGATSDRPARPSAAPKSRGTAKAAPAPTVEPEKVRADLAAIDDRAAAGRYLDDLRLTVPQLKALAKNLGIAVPSRATKADVRRDIVQWTVGRRLDSSAISRPAPARG
ncbi:hypothetical protein [Micromonospora saelicesensis]|uniref:Rho termination factor N-terminal domain-containing protein n=1 Tax=Micromonospora saelicesensis TaxID=285676 RepID=A0A1C4WEN2_9ACTN|nr:hypothetical protein [Micromonospora saelicesensis]SCE94642.1 hypothetical protein GA0070561_2636 [Micromonospora saelicesensis]